MNFLRSMLTGKDNATYDVVRVLAVLAVLNGLGLAVYVVVWKGSPFSLTDYGVGVGSLLAAVGGALKLKETTEP